MAHLLCVEDSHEFQSYLESVFKEHKLFFVSNIKEAKALIMRANNLIDLVILDVSLPDGNGIKLLPDLKQHFEPNFIPVIILTSDDDILTKVAAFGVGADDYLIKPPNTSELRARVESKLRIKNYLNDKKSNHKIGNLSLDVDQMLCQIDSPEHPHQTINLTPFEFKILRLLMSRPGQVYTREMIIDKVWGVDHFVTERTVDAHVSHLRKKIVASSVEIETVLSTGYKLIEKISK